MLEGLSAEEQAIAQQLLRGGIPAVRTALHFERERARDEGRPEPSTEGVLSIAESLASRVKAAEWRDRAEAALKGADDLAMRDLRSLVSSSDVAREEASRELVVALREMLEQRVEAHRTGWVNEVTKHLDEGHVLRALRLSARPPDPSSRFSAELATRLKEAASAALSPSAPSDKWLAILQAVVDSPVRRTVKPEGLPPNPTPELLEVARQQCGRVPALAPLLGLSVPPPPGPARPLSPTRPPMPHAPRRPKPSRPPVPAARVPKAAATEQRVAEPGVGEGVAAEDVAETVVAGAVAAELVAGVAEAVAAETGVSEVVAAQVVAEVAEAAAELVAEAVVAEVPTDEAAVAKAEPVAEESTVAEAETVSEPIVADPVAVDVERVADVTEPIAAEPAAEQTSSVTLLQGNSPAEHAEAQEHAEAAEAHEAADVEVHAVEVAPEPPEEVRAAPAGH